MRVFNGQTPDGLECSASLVMRKRGRWMLIVAIGVRRNGFGAVMLPSGVQPYEIPMGAPGENRPSDRTIGRAVLECIEQDARTRRANDQPVRGRTHEHKREPKAEPEPGPARGSIPPVHGERRARD